MVNNKVEEILKSIMDQVMNDNNSILNLNKWQWHQGVLLYGILAAYETIGDKRYIDFVKKWVDSRMEEGNIGKSINTTLPVVAAMKLYEITGEEKYYSICNEFAVWCMKEAPRADEGAFEHSCTENKYPNQIWADTLFMGCIFLAKWGRFTGETKYIDEAVRQYILHYKYLHDESTGLIYHGYYGNEKSKKGVLWGRGNGWLAAGAVDVLDFVNDEMPGKELLISNLKKHYNGMAKMQDESGAWHTVMDNSHTYLEMSATAAFAYGMDKALKKGYLPESFIEKRDRAFTALLENINNGKLERSSGGTPVMDDYTKYNAVPYKVTCFGQGLALLALAGKLN